METSVQPIEHATSIFKKKDYTLSTVSIIYFFTSSLFQD